LLNSIKYSSSKLAYNSNPKSLPLAKRPGKYYVAAIFLGNNPTCLYTEATNSEQKKVSGCYSEDS